MIPVVYAEAFLENYKSKQYQSIMDDIEVYTIKDYDILIDAEATGQIKLEGAKIILANNINN